MFLSQQRSASRYLVDRLKTHPEINIHYEREERESVPSVYSWLLRGSNETHRAVGYKVYKFP